jgi:hypothetical protein
MKRLFLLLVICSVFANCEYEEPPETVWHSYEFIVSGDCPYITIDNHDYYGLQYGVNYEETGREMSGGDLPWGYNIMSFTVEKKTTDATTVNAELWVDGVLVASGTTSDPGGHIIIEYEVE